MDLVHLRAAVIDELLVHLWRTHTDYCASVACLVAVGGYGRGELHPSSDVDIMLLLPDTIDADAEQALSDFITSLWDVGLEIGHSVRTVQQCVEQATADLTVATTLMEARLLDGPAPLYEAMQAVMDPQRLWSPAEFFAEKLKEQIARRIVGQSDVVELALISILSGGHALRHPGDWLGREAPLWRRYPR